MPVSTRNVTFSRNLLDEATLYNNCEWLFRSISTWMMIMIMMIIPNCFNVDGDYHYNNYFEVLQPGWSSSATQDPEWPAQIRSAVDLFKLGMMSIFARTSRVLEKYWIDNNCENISSSKKSIECAIVKFKMGTSWQPQSLRWGSNGTQNDPPVKKLFSKFWGNVKNKKSQQFLMPCYVMNMFHWTKWNKMRPPLSPNHPGSCTYLERLRGQGRPVVHCDFTKTILLHISSLLTFSFNLRENTNRCNESTWCSC